MIIDMQNAYYEGPTVAEMDAAAEYINWVIPHFEEKGLPIIWVYQVDESDGAIPGNAAFEFIDKLKPSDKHFKIHKDHGNSFRKTEADKILREAGVDLVVLSGFCAEFCVLATYHGAKDLDHFPVILKNGIASTNEPNRRSVEGLVDTISAGLLLKIISEA